MSSVGIKGKNDLVDLPEELAKLIIDISNEYDREDKLEREERRPLWMKLENYFNGFQRVYWDKVAKDWRVVDNKTETARHYDKIINSYRAHGESIIAALSVKPPNAVFYPADADVEEDITTAKACVKIKEIIERQNEAQLLIIKSLMILFNQGTVAAYIYNKKNSQYGTYSDPEYGDNQIVHTTQLNCTECGSNIDEVVSTEGKNKVKEEVKECPVCGFSGIPDQAEYEEEVPQIIGSIIQAKSRTCIDVFSPLFVYIPFYARKQEHIPYIRLRFEMHYSDLKAQFPKLRKKGTNKNNVDVNADERGLEIGLNTNNLTTVDCWWFRPNSLWILDNEDEKIKKLQKKYPDGLYCILVDDQLVHVNNENLDDHWQISNNPLSTYIHGEPLGKPLAPIQDISNEIVDLQIETFEHAIPETHARADVVDFKKYAKSTAAPGMIYPAMTPPDGQRLSDAFHTIKTATLSDENDVFLRRLEEKAQFVTGDFPSIFGGPATSGSKTAREYTESGARALQRLSLPWNVLKFFWAGTMSKAVPLYIHNMKVSGQDEKLVKKTPTSFINEWIRVSEISGNIGEVTADSEEELPQTAAQLKNVLIQLMTLKDEYISGALYHPNNAHLLAKALGAPDFYIPNSDERDKQYAEFAELLSGAAVEVNLDVDNHIVEGEVCESFLNSPTGLMVKKTNPEGWDAIYHHRMEHKMAEMQKQQMQASPGPVKPEGDANVQPQVQPPA